MIKNPLGANGMWIGLLQQIGLIGDASSPRGQHTRELLATTSIIKMNQPIVTAPARKLGYKFQAAEAAWILSKDNRVATIKEFSKDIAKFSDDGVTFFGAYGPRIISQIYGVAAKLVEDRDSRQAVLTIWRENPPASKDIPCTVALQWVIRENMLHCIVTMRSSDVWLGWPYDVFNFSMVSGYLAIMLKKAGVWVRLGNLYLTAGSQHLYERNEDGVAKVLEDPWFDGKYNDFNVDKFNEPEEFVDHLWRLANGGGTLEYYRRGN